MRSFICGLIILLVAGGSSALAFVAPCADHSPTPATGVLLFPIPQQVQIRTDDSFAIPPELSARVSRASLSPSTPVLDLLGEVFSNHPCQLTIHSEPAVPSADSRGMWLQILPEVVTRQGGYLLEIQSQGITLLAHDQMGAWYGLQTLRQLLQQFPNRLPGVLVEDYPHFPNRGFMLDISRDQVPTMETLKALIRLLARLKYNQLQLYMEHTFAYPGHQTVWQNASPLTDHDLLVLDQFCRDHMIELVPNQNSFGHMERWLRHAPYRELAEVPENPVCLAPSDAAVDLVRGLHNHLLGLTSSRQINVGCDETHQLGQGVSASAVNQHSQAAVYFEYLMKLHHNIASQGRIMQFWGDMLVPFDHKQRSERVQYLSRLPDDAIALVWGYRPDDPLWEQTALWRKAGVACYLCPGTSSWTSVSGRHERMVGNLRTALKAACDHDAIGWMLCDWGEFGLRPLPVILPGLLLSAAAAWNPSSFDHANNNLAEYLDLYGFDGVAPGFGHLLIESAGLVEKIGGAENNCPPHFVLLVAPQGNWMTEWLTAADPQGIRSALETMVQLRQQLENLPEVSLAGCPVKPELQTMLDLQSVLFELLLMMREQKLTAVNDLPDDILQDCRQRLDKIILPAVTKQWSLRYRDGGREVLEGHLQNLVAPE